MATSPTEVQKIEADVKKVYTFGKAHAILTIALVLSLFVGIWLYSGRGLEKAQAEAAASAEISKEKDAANLQLQQQNAQLAAQLAASEEQNKETAAALITAANALQAATKQKIASVPTLTPSALSVQWGKEANEPAPVIDTAGNFDVPLPLAQKSVQALIEAPALETENVQLQGAITAKTNALDAADQQLGSEKIAHASDNATCVVDKKTLNDQITVLKKANVKRNLKYMLLGGFIIEGLRIYLGHP
jgi:hypothetical protein